MIFVATFIFAHIAAFSIYLTSHRIRLSYNPQPCIDCPSTQTEYYPTPMISHNTCPSLRSKSPLLFLDCNRLRLLISLISFRRIKRTTSLVVYLFSSTRLEFQSSKVSLPMISNCVHLQYPSTMIARCSFFHGTKSHLPSIHKVMLCINDLILL